MDAEEFKGFRITPAPHKGGGALHISHEDDTQRLRGAFTDTVRVSDWCSGLRPQRELSDEPLFNGICRGCRPAPDPDLVENVPPNRRQASGVVKGNQVNHAASLHWRL